MVEAKERPRKLCPFTLIFPTKKSTTIARPNGGTQVAVNLGLPCAEDKCSWWIEKRNCCIVHEIQATLEWLVEEVMK